jgi:hypothetical protein
VTWGVNRWVLVDAGEHSLQRQVSTRGELAALLLEAGVDRDRADELASECWQARPGGAGSPSPTAGGSVWRATGLSRLTTLLVLLVVIGVFFVYFYFGRR